MQRVVKGFGDAEEIRSSVHDVPANLDVEVEGERDQPIEDLGHAAADGGGVDHLHRPAYEGTGQRADAVDFAASEQRQIVVQRGQCA